MSGQEKAVAGVTSTSTAIQSAQTEFTAEETTAEKIQQNLIAKFSLAGFLVHTLDDGGFLVCRWSHARHCHDLRELHQFAKGVGVTQ